MRGDHVAGGAREGRADAVLSVEVSADERGIPQQDEGCRDLVGML